MRLAIFQTEETFARQISQDDAGMRHAEGGQNRQDQRLQPGKRGDHQLARDILAAPLDAACQLRELVIGGGGDAQEILARLGRGIAAWVTLEEFDAQPLFQRVDMADHGGMVNAQHLGGAADRAHAGDVIGGADFIPVVHRGLLGRWAAFCAGLHMSR